MSTSISHLAYRNTDVLVLGGGAAGLFCAATAGRRGRKVVLLEHNDAVGEKIRISGGGRCNFTNRKAGPENFISENPDFCRSALNRYPPDSFISLVEKHKIAFHEKKLGQLFCDGSSQQIIDMLLEECREGGVEIHTGSTVRSVDALSSHKSSVAVVAPLRANSAKAFSVVSDRGTFQAESLVIATGGLSVPKLGATPIGYKIAEQFGLRIIPPRAGLVPFRLDRDAKGRRFADLSGVSLDAEVSCGETSFRENLLFTHRGLSGPAILQISSYWKNGEAVVIDLLPGTKVETFLKHTPDRLVANALSEILPARFMAWWISPELGRKRVKSLTKRELDGLESSIHRWIVNPTGTEGFAKAEVTAGGVDTRDLSSKTFEARNVKGLYFVGEVVDVTGWLGGYNFQWAWSSGYAAGRAA